MPVISAQDEIIIPQHFSEFLFLVINHFVRSEIPHHLNISRAGGRRHFCAEIFRNLDCERAYPTRASRDDHLLPQLKVCASLSACHEVSPTGRGMSANVT